MKKPGKAYFNTALPGFFMFIFLIGFMFLTSILNAKTMIMVSRLDFVPAMLEMVKLNLEENLKFPISLNFQPVLNNKPIFVRRKPDYLLVEKGFPDKSLPIGYRQVPDAEISLVWVLGLNSQAAKYLKNDGINNLKEFAQFLMRIKKAKPSIFPWFEAIFSKNTFYNLNVVLGEGNRNSTRIFDNKQFWNYKGAVEILHQAMTEELLNPLSLEADELLAFDVFRAGDCMATSFWVPIEYIIDSNKAASYLGEVSLMPFPTIGGKGIVPQVTLNLWQKIDDTMKLNVANSCLTKSKEFTLLESSFQETLDWTKDKFVERYDKLVVGDFD